MQIEILFHNQLTISNLRCNRISGHYRDAGVAFALSDEPFLLLWYEGVTLARVLSEAGESVLLIGVPPVFEGARGITTTVIAGPRFGRGALECVYQGEAFFEALGEVSDGAVADESALFL